MRTYVDSRFLAERERFRLLCTCECCQHFDPQDEFCSLGFPTAPHREAVHQRAREGEAILFCKYFTID